MGASGAGSVVADGAVAGGLVPEDHQAGFVLDVIAPSSIRAGVSHAR